MFHVKHQDAIEAPGAQTIARALNDAGVECTPVQASLLARHAALVLQENVHLNLTAITDPQEFVALHIVDSLAYVPAVAPLQEPVVDLGSGAGYPGIPLAVCLGLRVILCEARRKRAAFLQRVVDELGCSAEVHAGRSEEYAERETAQAGTVVARAVAATASLVELAAPLLRHGGRLIALKGSPPTWEIEAADAAAVVCGMQKRALIEYHLPGRDERRVAIVYERVSDPRVKLPRRPGLAQSRPLGR